jgi:hypothetical protein
VVGIAAIDDVLRPALAACGLFAVCGFGLVRLWLPAELRANEALWVLPVGACAAAAALGLLGYARVPFALNLGLVLLLGVALGVIAVRRAGLPARPARRAASAGRSGSRSSSPRSRSCRCSAPGSRP